MEQQVLELGRVLPAVQAEVAALRTENAEIRNSNAQLIAVTSTQLPELVRSLSTTRQHNLVDTKGFGRHMHFDERSDVRRLEQEIHGFRRWCLRGRDGDSR